MLLLAETPAIKHPPMELLFTVDEETGLNGAKGLQPGFVEGRILLNLDSEDEGVFTIGCAGGVDTTVTLGVQPESIPAGAALVQLVVGGLKGGHSGIDIAKHRANANKMLARTLAHIRQQTPLGLVTLTGGSRKNAIPRDARALIWVPVDKQGLVFQAALEMEATLKAEFIRHDSRLFIKATACAEPLGEKRTLSQENTDRALWILLALPNAVDSLSSELEGLVETSSNLATMDIKAGKFCVVSSQRSAVVSRLAEITASIHALARLAGAEVDDKDAYPPWQPKVDSVLLARSKNCYRKLYGEDPVVQVIHAGLECAIIGAIYPGMDMISFGPTMRNPHSPDERLYIPSIAKVWDFLVALLAQMCTAQ
jgi:dipeptidase D